VVKTAVEKTYDRLVARLADLPSLVVAFSGGTDSTFLLATAQKAVRGRVLAVTVRSPAFATREVEHAEATAHVLRAEHVFLDSGVAAYGPFRINPPDRCYYCKEYIFRELKRFAEKQNVEDVADGTTADELEGHRPGARAAAELGVLSPLAEVGLTKEDVRRLARDNGVPNFDRPPSACLATRFATGEEITAEKLKLIGDAEQVLANLGFRQIRCRFHGPFVRIELDPKELPRAAEAAVRGRIAEELHRLGFTFVTLDLDGYRSGSMGPAADDAGDGPKPKGVSS
jgi:uncharacterized protein